MPVIHNTKFTIHLLKADNSGLLIDLFIKSIHETANKDYSPEQIKAWSQIDPEQWHNKFKELTTWVAVTKENFIIGFISLQATHYIEMLYVHPTYQRIGVATQLLKKLEDQEMIHHIKMLSTDASITAKPFFEKHQFTVVTHQQVHCRGQILTNFQMKKYF
ncbi:Ribosomal protein S18 acetylase RimI and related acetyltransferases (RimI) (PDB:1GHE) [Commensalibacter communis]|nr:Ribosomal protein S18 acetylase RimI and related acetyltransferases (RimI) (PDB:1GHE) [Commensalibacter communis]CAI3943351.1 Ribosomal protein S18 acetylase RimI and related acetyltransferases (RimI) (PDB:1GHE) [Commensalibacter communis]